MWGFWILLCAAFYTEFCAVESVELKYGQKLSIKLTDKSSTHSPKRFTISSVNFNDQGTYTQKNNLKKVISDKKVKVLPSTETQSLKTGQTLTISLSGLSKEEAGLHFSNKDIMQQGSPVPDYSKRIKVTSSSIQLLHVQVSDGGRYTVLDSKGREVKVITLKVIDPCASKIENMEVSYGHQLNIYLLHQIDSLGFTSVNNSQNYIIWSSSVQPKRGTVKGSGFDRNFIINPVSFEDQGVYTQRNKVSKVICATKVKVVTSTDIQYCVAGEAFTISLAGLSKNEASLHFSKKDVNLMLVQRGSPVRNLTNYNNRIQVTSSSIQVLNVDVSDVGQYTLFDGKHHKVKTITLELTKPTSWKTVVIIVAVALLVGISICCYKAYPIKCDSRQSH